MLIVAAIFIFWLILGGVTIVTAFDEAGKYLEPVVSVYHYIAAVGFIVVFFGTYLILEVM